jgi:hypothetical protein
MATVGTRCKRVPCALVVVDSALSYGVIPRLRKSVTGAARQISPLGRLTLAPAAGDGRYLRGTTPSSELARSGSRTSSRAFIAALLSPSVRFNDSLDCSVLDLLLPIRTTPPMAGAIRRSSGPE